VILEITDSTREYDTESPPTWYTLYLRSVGLVEMLRYRCPDIFSFVLRSFSLPRRFRLSASLYIRFNKLVTSTAINY